MKGLLHAHTQKDNSQLWDVTVSCTQLCRPDCLETCRGVDLSGCDLEHADAGPSAAEVGAEGGSPGKENEQRAEQEANTHPFGFPLSLVKRVMCLDPEVVRVSGDGLKAVAKAAELMLADMAAKACSAAQGQKRRTIKLSDVEQTGVVPAHHSTGFARASLHASQGSPERILALYNAISVPCQSQHGAHCDGGQHRTA